VPIPSGDCLPHAVILRSMADPNTVRNLQAYIYKRPQDQTRAQIFAHIEKVHSQLRLTPANWAPFSCPRAPTLMLRYCGGSSTTAPGHANS
jgi:hypothetical protein